MHHGTLLFNSDLKNLGDAIKVISGKYQSKAVQSNRSEVANISSFLKKNITVDEFIQFLLDVQLENDENIFYELNENDTQNIEVLVNEKFKTWQWNFGYSPKYLFKNEIEIEGKKLSIELNVKKGIIEDCNISGDYFSVEVAHHLQNLLQNKRHIFEDLKEIIKEIQDSFSDDLIYTFF